MRSISLLITTGAALVLLTVLSCPLLAQKLTCAGCGKPITQGQWVQVEGKNFHPEHFVCANCGKPIGRKEYFSKDGKNFDRECYEERFSKKCGYCGGNLIGEFTTVDDKSYHTSCFIDHVAPRCGVCNVPLNGKYVLFEGRKYHERCYQQSVAITCSYCGGIIEGKYLKDFWGNSYHEAHKDKARECDFCQRLITPEMAASSRKWSDGRSLCTYCAPSAITDPEEAESLLVVAAVKLRLLGIDVDPADVSLELVDLLQLKSLTKNGEANIKGFTDWREGQALFGLIKARKVRVYLLFGMPRLQMLHAATHELMHVWQFQHGRLHNDKALSEGSCNFASYLVLRDLSSAEAQYLTTNIEQDTLPYYGDGFRRVKSYVEQHGIDAWLEHLRKHDTPPW